MGFWKTLFGGEEETPEQEQQHQAERDFDVLKTDGQKASRLGRHEYAVACFTKALEIHDDLETRDYLAHEYIRMGQFDEALGEIKVLQDAEPDNAQIALLRANVKYMQEDYDGMKETLLPFANAETTYGESHLINYWVAKAFIGLGELGKAIDYLTKSISDMPDYWDAYLLRAQTYLKSGDVDLAEKDANFLLAQLGEQEETLLMQARVEAKKDKLDDALAIYNKVVDANPFSVEGLRERGMLKKMLGDEAGGEADIAEADEVNGTGAQEDIEEKTKQMYKNIDAYGIFG